MRATLFIALVAVCGLFATAAAQSSSLPFPSALTDSFILYNFQETFSRLFEEWYNI
jgi:hypothetical protein